MSETFKAGDILTWSSKALNMANTYAHDHPDYTLRCIKEGTEQGSGAPIVEATCIQSGRTFEFYKWAVRRLR